MINAENIQVFLVFHAVFISFTEVYDDIEDPYDPYTFANLCNHSLTFISYHMISINTTQLVNDSSGSMIIVVSVFKVCLKTLE